MYLSIPVTSARSEHTFCSAWLLPGNVDLLVFLHQNRNVWRLSCEQNRDSKSHTISCIEFIILLTVAQYTTVRCGNNLMPPTPTTHRSLAAKDILS